tara:strand:- start:703 stop:2955 length:2253 start_codon:yes stop_codon:yes gene_type:complete
MAARKKKPEASPQIVMDFIAEFFAHSNTIFCIQDGPIGERGWPPSDLRSFIERFEGLSTANASFYISTMIGSNSHRNSQDNFGGLAAIVLDDIGTKGVNISDLPLEPSYIIESSKENYQCGYVFDAPLEDLDRSKAMVQHIYGMGIADAGGALVNKFVRLPWGIRNKIIDDELDTFKCRLIAWSKIRYTADEIQQAFNVPTAPSFSATFEIVDSTAQAMIDEGWVVGTNGEGILIECPWGESHTDRPKDHAIYYPLGTTDNPESRGFRCHHDSCKNRRGDDVAALLRESYPIPASAELEYTQQRYCLIEQSGLVGDFMSKAVDGDPTARLNDFKNSRTYMINTGRWTAGRNAREIWKKLGEEWQDGYGTERVKSVVYDPINENRVVDNHFNLFRRCDHPQASGEEPEEYLRHVEHILPDEDDRELFHDWTAFKLQNPSKRSYMYLMLTDGVFGIGRSVTGKILAQVFQAGVNAINFNVFTGKTHTWTDWKDQSQLIIIEEIKDDSNNYVDAVRAYEEIKANCDVDVTQVEIHKKFQSPRQAYAYYNVLGFSNHPDAIRIPDDDRRIYVAKNTSNKRTNDEYAAIHGVISNPQAVADIYHWLINRDVSQFDSKTPPMNAAKQRMFEMTQTSNERIIGQMVEELTGDLVFRHQLKNVAMQLLMDEGYDSNSREWGFLNRDVNKLWRELPKLMPDDKRHGGRLKLPGMSNPEAVRVLRNTSKWQGKLKSKVENKALVNEILSNEKFSGGGKAS